MKVELSASAGFCVGVKRAIDTALEAAESDQSIYMLGDIVHNEFVVKRIKEKGIKKIKKLGSGKGRTLLIRAHGAPLSVYRAAKRAGYRMIDATCPMVKEIHRIARADEKKGRKIVIIGDSEHDEVLGIKGSLTKRPVVIDPREPLPVDKLKKIEKASVVVQSTQNIEKVLGVVDRLSGIIKDLLFHDTICRPTKKRQKDAQSLPLRNDVVVVIGSRTSANTKRLYEISRSLNKRTCWISSADELEPGFLRGAKSAGVLAGASTPDDTIKEVVSFLRKL